MCGGIQGRQTADRTQIHCFLAHSQRSRRHRDPAMWPQSCLLDQPAPLSLLLQLGPERLEFELAFWIAVQDKDNHAVILSAVNMALWRLLQPFSTLDMPKKPD